MKALDLVVFVPLLDDDDIAGNFEYPTLRQHVDARLKSMLRDQECSLFEEGPPLLEVFGQRKQRVEMVLAGLPVDA